MTARTIAEKRLESVAPEIHQQAQERLDELCDKYEMERITLTNGKSRWRELCYRMCGIPPVETKPAGRKKVLSDAEKDTWFQYAAKANLFAGNGIGF